MIPQWEQISTNNQNHDPLWKGLFEVTIDFPASIGASTQDVKLMLENSTSINLPVTPELDVQTQQFKYLKRYFLGFPTDTGVPDLSLKFNLNQDEQNRVYVWNLLKKWYDLAWNSQTGETGLTRELIGSIIVNCHNKRGQIYRKVIYKNVQLVGLSALEYDWESYNDIQKDLEAKFVSPYWIDISV